MKFFTALQRRAPQLSDLSGAMRKALPAAVTNFEWVEVQFFGRIHYKIRAWVLGGRRPLRWSRDGRWE